MLPTKYGTSFLSQLLLYTTQLDPVFVQHLNQLDGQTMALMTTAGRVEVLMQGSQLVIFK
ncbi:hypothetical protein CFK37_02845 [Virgibacillus phasianinus]|uniref:DUF2642 domain-containing protein n=1 Tax=Virgibacillus phasianinus TaxID=2017483 RepID=A0A220TYZ3_9BACI|nr:hypothetical protein CFK37_02845 [Virgibacillus phasianinus]